MPSVMETTLAVGVFFGVPGLLAAAIFLALARKGLRGSRRESILALIFALAGVLIVGGGAYYGFYQTALERVSECETAASAYQQPDPEEGDYSISQPYYDCEDEGLIVILPFFATLAALVVVIVGAAVMRVSRPR